MQRYRVTKAATELYIYEVFAHTWQEAKRLAAHGDGKLLEQLPTGNADVIAVHSRTGKRTYYEVAA